MYFFILQSESFHQSTSNHNQCLQTHGTPEQGPIQLWLQLSPLPPRTRSLCVGQKPLGGGSTDTKKWWEIVPSFLLVFSEVSNWCHTRGGEVGYPESSLWITPPLIEMCDSMLRQETKGRGQPLSRAWRSTPAKGRTSSSAWLVSSLTPACIHLRFNS